MTYVSAHFVCFACRKQFRKTHHLTYTAFGQKPFEFPAPLPCPQCEQPMVDMGRFFRAPKQQEKATWEQLRLLALHGVRFTRATMVDTWGAFFTNHGGARWAKAQIAQCSCHTKTPGKRLLQTIAQNKTRQQGRAKGPPRSQ
jgi:hypothetical protein